MVISLALHRALTTIYGKGTCVTSSSLHDHIGTSVPTLFMTSFGTSTKKLRTVIPSIVRWLLWPKPDAIHSRRRVPRRAHHDMHPQDSRRTLTLPTHHHWRQFGAISTTAQGRSRSLLLGTRFVAEQMRRRITAVPARWRVEIPDTIQHFIGLTILVNWRTISNIYTIVINTLEYIRIRCVVISIVSCCLGPRTACICMVGSEKRSDKQQATQNGATRER